MFDRFNRAVKGALDPDKVGQQGRHRAAEVRRQQAQPAPGQFRFQGLVHLF